MAFINYTGSGIPSFADPFGIVAKQYGVNPNKMDKDPEQFRIIGPTGSVMAHEFTEITMTAALTKAHFNFKGKGYDKRLDDAVNLLERGDYIKGAKKLDDFRGGPKKDKPDVLRDSADQLFAALHKMGEEWKADIDKLPLNSVSAYVLYLRLKDVFPGDPLGKNAEENVDKLKDNKDFKNDLNAYNNFQRMNTVMANAVYVAKPKKESKNR